ncbi:chalcone isomerase family protein [Puniceicoccaceae bacterium K14]|nr:chalcone isomerase family protein [Puniceicoccaceae bacterium K14]
MKSIALIVFFLTSLSPPLQAELGNLSSVASTKYKYLGFIPLFEATYSTRLENKNDDRLGEFSKSLKFVYKRKITKKQLIQAADKILNKSYNQSELSTISKELEAINALYENVTVGDELKLFYQPDKGTTLFRNDKPLKTIAGSDFHKIYFSIWLGPDSPFSFEPID